MDVTPMNTNNLRVLDRSSLGKKYTKRLLRSSVTLPSQYAAYAVCTEYVKKWFLSKFPEHYFNSIYVSGTHSFDEFRKFSEINENIMLKKSNPILGITPVIDNNYNRDWIDSNPEFPMLLRRSRMEGTFFNDIRDNRGLHLQLQFKTITMQFAFRIRVDTKAQGLDTLEYIKLKHRAGYTQSDILTLDIHVPKQIISQIAFDNGIKIYDNGDPVDSFAMLKYLNSHSLIPFLYKFRCATGNNEYFIKVPNCQAHIKSELPSMDDGEAQSMTTSNFNIEFNIEVEMTAPYCYTYYSQHEQKYISDNIRSNTTYCLMMATRTDIPSEDEHHWKMITDEPMEYLVDDEDVGTEIEIDLSSQLAGTDLGKIIKYSTDTEINPYAFMNIKLFNDGEEMPYEIDWKTLNIKIKKPIGKTKTYIALYCDNGYIMETLKYLTEMDKNPSRTS